MKFYALSSTDVSPNAMRSSYNPTQYWLSRTPGETNLSHRQLNRGWLGTTNDIYYDALGEFDTDKDDWVHDLQAALGDDVEIDEDELVTWLNDEEQEDLELESTEGDVVESRSATWSYTDSDRWWPEPKSGWKIILFLDDPGSYIFDAVPDLDDEQQSVLKNCDLDFDMRNDALVAIVSAAADCDDISYADMQTYAFWRYLLVKNEDWDRAVNSLITAAKCFSEGMELDAICALVKNETGGVGVAR